MKKEAITTGKAPSAIGPYSQGINLGDLVFTSGQIPINPQTGEIPETIEEQTKQALTNLSQVLKATGLEMDDLIKTTVFLKDMSLFTIMNDVYGTFFEEPYPARSAVEVARLPKDVLIEVEGIALRKKQ